MSWRPTKDSTKLLLASQRLFNEHSSSITLRQLYYLLVGEGFVDYDLSSYRKVKNLMINARRHGRIDPSTFSFHGPPINDSENTNVNDYLRRCMNTYRIPRTCFQPNHIEIWVEREAMKVYIDSLVSQYDIPVYVTGGYSTFSFSYEAEQRIKSSLTKSGSPRILYFSDFSPSSFNMYESQISEMSQSLGLTTDETRCILVRVGVNIEHIVKYELPILETIKSTPKTAAFEQRYGEVLTLVNLPKLPVVEIESLKPSDLSDIVFNTILSLIDQKAMAELAILEAKNDAQIRNKLGAVNDKP